MFYEEIKIKELLTCPKCKEPLVDAHFLPCCGESVCARCLPSTASENERICAVCSRKFDENNNPNTNQANYQPNKALNRVISLQPTEVYRGEHIYTLREKTVTMGAEIDDLKSTDDTMASTEITEHCRRLRDEVINRTTLTLEGVKFESESILAKIDAYQNACEESYRGGKTRFVESLKTLESEFTEYRRRLEKLLAEPHSGAGRLITTPISSMLDEASRLKLKVEAAKLALQKLMFTKSMLEYHECPRATLGCILVDKKLSPTFVDLTSLNIKQELLDAPDILFTYFQIGFLQNGHLVLSVSDGDIFRSIYVLDLTKCESMSGYLVKKLDLFTKKSPIFDVRVEGNFILHSHFEFKANTYEMVLRDTKLGQLAKMTYLISELIDVATHDSRVYLLKQNKTVDVFKLDENAGIGYERTINVATMCRHAVCAPCCSCFWTTPTSFEMEFKVKGNKLFFKSTNRMSIFESIGEPSDGPIGSFSLRGGPSDSEEPKEGADLSETKRDLAGTSWWITRNDEIIVHLKTQQKLVYFDLSGVRLLERDLSDFPNSQKLSFCLDEHDNVFLYDNENIYI